jgi:hypothetical protein
MRTDPGWVRYKRGRVDWQRIKGVSFYTWNEHFRAKELRIDVGPFHVLSFAQLDVVFHEHPERVRGNRSLPWRVLREGRPDRMMADYHRKRAEERAAALREKYPPAKLAAQAGKVREALAATYLMPPRFPKPRATLVRTGEVDGVRTELQLLQVAEGVYSPAVVFLPAGATKPGSPGWATWCCWYSHSARRSAARTRRGSSRTTRRRRRTC